MQSLRAVLKINLEQVGSVAYKIEQGAFAIRDCATGRGINLSSTWERCFSPGQRVEMSVILFAYQTSLENCPKCNHACNSKLEEDSKWYNLPKTCGFGSLRFGNSLNCGIAFRNSTRKPQLQLKSASVSEEYEELPFHDRLHQFKSILPRPR